MCHAVVVGLGAVVRILLGDALAVAGRAVAVDPHQDEVFVVDAAEAGLEEVDERELQETQLQTFDLHRAMISSGRLAVPLHRDRRADRRRQNRARRTPRHAPRRHGRARGNRESVPRRLLRRPSGRRAAGAALLSAQSPPPADRAAPGRSLQPDRRSATTCSTRTRSSRTSISTTTSCSSISASTICSRATCRRPISSSTCRRRPTCCCAASTAAGMDAGSGRAPARRRVPARAERGVPPLLLPLQRRRRCSSSKPRSSIPTRSDEALDDLIKQIRGMGPGTRYYVPRTK